MRVFTGRPASTLESHYIKMIDGCIMVTHTVSACIMITSRCVIVVVFLHVVLCVAQQGTLLRLDIKYNFDL